MGKKDQIEEKGKKIPGLTLPKNQAKGKAT